MWYNNANCDLYIGKGAGNKLVSDMENAKSSIKIVSPYLSPSLIKELIKLRNKNIDIQLITTDTIEDFYGSYEKNICKLILQNRETDTESENVRNKWIELIKILLYVMFALLVLIAGLAYLTRDFKVGFGLIPIIVLFLIYKRYQTKVKNKRIFNYWYRQLFPFKVYRLPEKKGSSDTFSIHAKIYLIDESIAYLGSLNFTESGTKHNYETRIRTTDKKAVDAINVEINQLFNHSHLPERDIQRWGKQLYPEPIN